MVEIAWRESGEPIWKVVGVEWGMERGHFKKEEIIKGTTLKLKKGGEGHNA